jgi:iron(III) transport system permease protein
LLIANAPLPNSTKATVHILPAKLTRAGWRGVWTMAGIYGAAAVVTFLVLIPVAFIFWAVAETGLGQVAALILRWRVAELVVNTLLLLVVTIPCCACLAVALAWLTERCQLPGMKWLPGLLVAPLAIPAFVHSYAWVSLDSDLSGLAAAVFIAVLAYYPFLSLPVAATLRRLDPALEDAAASLGQTPRQVFRRVVLPQLRLAVLGGAQLVGLHLLAEYGLFALVRFDTLTTAVVDQFQSSYNGPAPMALGIVLVMCALGLLWLEARMRGWALYARLGSGAARPVVRVSLTPLHTWLAGGLIAATVLAAIGVPMLTLARWLWLGGAHVWAAAELMPSIVTTAMLALAAATATVLAALPVAWLGVRVPGRFGRTVEACNYVIGALPGVIVAMALIFVTVRVAQPLYQTAMNLILAYVILFLPRAIVGLRASMAQVPASLEEAAVNLGRTPPRAIVLTTLRLAAPGAAAGLAMAALGITNELTATLLLAPNGTRTLATAFWDHASELDYAAAAPFALMMIALSLPLTLVLRLPVLGKGRPT